MKSLFDSVNKGVWKLHISVNTFEQLSAYVKVYFKRLQMQLLESLSQFDFTFK